MILLSLWRDRRLVGAPSMLRLTNVFVQLARLLGAVPCCALPDCTVAGIISSVCFINLFLRLVVISGAERPRRHGSICIVDDECDARIECGSFAIRS